MNTMNATQTQGKDTNTRKHNPIRFAPVGSNNQSNRILGERPLGRITKGEIGKRMIESKSNGESSNQVESQGERPSTTRILDEERPNT